MCSDSLRELESFQFESGTGEGVLDYDVLIS